MLKPSGNAPKYQHLGAKHRKGNLEIYHVALPTLPSLVDLLSDVKSKSVVLFNVTLSWMGRTLVPDDQALRKLRTGNISPSTELLILGL